MISRRQFFAVTAAWSGALGVGRASAQSVGRAPIAGAPAAAIGLDGSRAEHVDVTRDWDGSMCRARVTNRGAAPVRIKEVVLLDVELNLPPETALYGEGFQMLSQTAGTLGAPADLSQYTDATHYKMPAAPGSRAGTTRGRASPRNGSSPIPSRARRARASIEPATSRASAGRGTWSFSAAPTSR